MILVRFYGGSKVKEVEDSVISRGSLLGSCLLTGGRLKLKVVRRGLLSRASSCRQLSQPRLRIKVPCPHTSAICQLKLAHCLAFFFSEVHISESAVVGCKSRDHCPSSKCSSQLLLDDLNGFHRPHSVELLMPTLLPLVSSANTDTASEDGVKRGALYSTLPGYHCSSLLPSQVEDLSLLNPHLPSSRLIVVLEMLVKHAQLLCIVVGPQAEEVVIGRWCHTMELCGCNACGGCEWGSCLLT